MSNSPTTHDEIFREIGLALSAWSRVELALSSLFIAISRVHPQERASAIIDVIVSLETRLSVINGLMSLENMKKDEAAIWKKLSDKVRKSYKTRHQIAHFSTTFERGQALIMPFLTYDKLFVGNMKYLNAQQIRRYLTEFEELESAIRWTEWESFLRNSKSKTPPPQTVPEPPLIARLRASVAQTP